MAHKIPSFTLQNGALIPAIGLGTYMLFDADKMVAAAIDYGYRHIDSAFIYRTEESVGKGIREKIKDGTVRRDELFVTTKLWDGFHRPEDVPVGMKKSLTNLGLDYVDLYLIHWPVSGKLRENEYDMHLQEEDPVPLEDTWKAMEKLVDEGLCKMIGVSNFNSKQLSRILAICKHFPVTNQIEVNPYFNNKRLIQFCKSKNVMVVGAAPFYMSPKPRPHHLLVKQPIVQDLAKKHGKTPGQIVLRYEHQLGVIPIPKTNTMERLQENLGIFGDWKGLDSEDMAAMDTLQTGQRSYDYSFPGAEHFSEHPFHEEF